MQKASAFIAASSNSSTTKHTIKKLNSKKKKLKHNIYKQHHSKLHAIISIYHKTPPSTSHTLFLSLSLSFDSIFSVQNIISHNIISLLSLTTNGVDGVKTDLCIVILSMTPSLDSSCSETKNSSERLCECVKMRY